MRVYIALEPASVEHVVSNVWSGGSEEFWIGDPEVLIAGFSNDIRNGTPAGKVNCSEVYRL